MTEPTAPEGLVVPRAIAVIMDGNGRWALEQGLERIRGHEHGIRAVRETATECARLGVEVLTMYAFSEENWQRPDREVGLLMVLLRRFLVEERPILMDNQIRLLHTGRAEKLPADVLELLRETQGLTANNDGMKLVLAISYGGRAELADAMGRIAKSVAAGKLAPEDIDEDTIRAHLYLPELPDPDLLIRTAGEMRVSNFLLWQISYSEIYVSPVCWPDFGKEHLWAALEEFGRRRRKFGKVVP